MTYFISKYEISQMGIEIIELFHFVPYEDHISYSNHSRIYSFHRKQWSEGEYQYKFIVSAFLSHKGITKVFSIVCNFGKLLQETKWKTYSQASISLIWVQFSAELMNMSRNIFFQMNVTNSGSGTFFDGFDSHYIFPKLFN